MPKHKLPPDPEGMNEKRAEWAHDALVRFMDRTRQTDEDEALGDLLCDFHHLADRQGLDLAKFLSRARECYLEEIDGPTTTKIRRLIARAKLIPRAKTKVQKLPN